MNIQGYYEELRRTYGPNFVEYIYQKGHHLLNQQFYTGNNKNTFSNKHIET